MTYGGRSWGGGGHSLNFQFGDAPDIWGNTVFELCSQQLSLQQIQADASVTRIVVVVDAHIWVVDGAEEEDGEEEDERDWTFDVCLINLL